MTKRKRGHRCVRPYNSTKPHLSPSIILSLDLHRISGHRGREKHDDPVRSPVTSGASSGSGQFFVDIHIGTPPKSFLLVVDIGSDLFWLKCSACISSAVAGKCSDAAYSHILNAFKRLVKKFELPKSVESTQGFDLCINAYVESMATFPKLSFTLGGGALFAPPPRNNFIDTADRVKYLAIQPVGSSTGFSVIGNLMQQGYLFEFDEDKSQLGFSRYGCAIQ